MDKPAYRFYFHQTTWSREQLREKWGTEPHDLALQLCGVS